MRVPTITSRLLKDISSPLHRLPELSNRGKAKKIIDYLASGDVRVLNITLNTFGEAGCVWKGQKTKVSSFKELYGMLDGPIRMKREDKRKT